MLLRRDICARACNLRAAIDAIIEKESMTCVVIAHRLNTVRVASPYRLVCSIWRVTYTCYAGFGLLFRDAGADKSGGYDRSV